MMLWMVRAKATYKPMEEGQKEKTEEFSLGPFSSREIAELRREQFAKRWSREDSIEVGDIYEVELDAEV